MNDAKPEKKQRETTENTLGVLLDEIVTKYPDRVALIAVGDYRTRYLTFSELREEVLRAMAWLEHEGYTRGDRVLVCAPNTAETLVLLLACATAGLEGVPVDLNVSSGILGRIIEASEARIVVTSREDLLCQSDDDVRRYPIRCLFADTRKFAENHPESFAQDIDASALLYLFFTSGTTGDPKGVPITHENLVSNVRAFAKLENLELGDRVLSLAPLNHVLGLTVGLFIPWFYGNAMVFSTDLAPTRLMKILIAEDVSVIVTVPVFLDRVREKIHAKMVTRFGAKNVEWLLARTPKLPSSTRRKIFTPVLKNFAPHLSWIACGGAALSVETQGFWEALGIKIVQGYGLTETLIATSTGFADRKIGSVGRNLPGQEIEIDDKGEILLRGPNVCEGYYENPAANDEAFSDGWFHTGDLGRIDDDGYVYITGRAKNVIIGPSGINIYPEDIELTLNEHPCVLDSVVMESPTHPGQLWAVIIPSESDPNPDLEALRSESTALLSTHQRLQRIVIWSEDDFPRTGTKKIKRGPVQETILAGCEKDDEGNSEGEDAGEPRGSVSAVIAQVADVAEGSVEESTLLGADLGLDSLALSELLARIEAELGVVLEGDDVFNKDISAGHLEQLVEGSSGDAVVASDVAWRDGPVTRVAQACSRAFVPFFFRRRFDLDIAGLENVKDVDSDRYILISNHQSHLDWLSLWTALPNHHRKRLSPAAAFDYFYKGKSRAQIFMLHALAPFLPWRRSASPRAAISSVGERLDSGWNVLVFPEGTRSRNGELAEFKATIGLLIRELDVPVLPAFLEGTYALWPPQEKRPKSGAISVKFGEPMRFSWNDEPHEIRDRLWDLYR